MLRYIICHKFYNFVCTTGQSPLEYHNKKSKKNCKTQKQKNQKKFILHFTLLIGNYHLSINHA